MTEIPGLLVNHLYGPHDTTFNSSFRNQAVANYMDGIPVSRHPKQAGDLNFLPNLDNVERIDFYNNASTSLGVRGISSINYVTKNPTLDTPFRLSTNHTLGSNELYSMSTQAEGTVDQFGYLLSVSHQQMDGIRHNSDFSDFTSNAKFLFNPNEDQLWTLGYFSEELERGEPGGLTTTQYNSNRDNISRRLNREWNGKHTGYLRTNIKLSEDAGFEMTGYGSIEDHTTREQLGTEAGGLNATRLRNSTVIGARAKLYKTWDIQGDKQNLNVGFDYDFYKDTNSAHQATQLSLNDTRARYLTRRLSHGGGVYLENQFQFGKFKITPGARLDIYSVAAIDDYYNLTLVSGRRDYPNIDRTQVDFIPKFSLQTSYEILHKTDLFLEVMQDHTNIDVDTLSQPGSATKISSGNFSPQNTVKYEGGLRGNIRPWADYSGSLFLIDADDIMTTTNSGSITIAQNNRRLITRGMEGKMRVVVTHLWQDLIENKSKYEPSKWGDVALSGNISILDSQTVSGRDLDRQPPTSPDFTIKGGLYYTYEKLIKMGITGMWVEEYFAASDNSTPGTGIPRDIPTFMVWDYNFEIWPIENRLRLMFGIHNIFDEDYYMSASNLGIDPAPQRNFYLGVGLVF